MGLTFCGLFIILHFAASSVRMEDILRGGHGNIPRTKEYLMAGSVPLRFDLADGRYAIIGTEQPETPMQCTFIGCEIDEPGLFGD